jgi:hypothetical protein
VAEFVVFGLAATHSHLNMKTKPNTDLAYRLSLLIGPLSGPFVFKAAALRDFPTMQFSHFLIIVCYVVGAIALSQLIVRKLLRAFGGGTEESIPAVFGSPPPNTP